MKLILARQKEQPHYNDVINYYFHLYYYESVIFETSLNSKDYVFLRSPLKYVIIETVATCIFRFISIL